MNFQDFLNKYGDKGEITSQSINQASAAGVSTKDLNKFVDKAGDKLGDNVFEGKSGNILSGGGGGSSSGSGGGGGSSSGSGGGYSGLDMDLGAYETMAAIDTANQDFLNQGGYNNAQIIAGIYADAQKYGDDAAIQIADLTSGRESEWRKYMADQDRIKAENVATIQGEYGLDLQEIITAGLKDVEKIRGEYGLESDKLRGEYGLEGERIKGDAARDVASRQKDAQIFGSLMSGFW